ncbi:MAG: 5-formyltetrahydrofolate cyclo-ligase [Clostridiales bacterium]|nr:5-formyltetrahydrofolate cyclo-ligase [Clostridiales bacterium]
MPVEDIRPLKAGLRAKYKELRRTMPPEEKQRRDTAIARRVLSLWQYRRCDTLLTYVSTDIEVDTRRIMERALADGKRVAVPRCVPGTRRMEFYLIRSAGDLEPGTFGVLEPRPDSRFLLPEDTDGLCLVPALCYDWKGFRLGYGKGYYDRFLSGFRGRIIGLCYSSCVRRRLPHGRFDRPVELLVTERFLRRTGEKSAAPAQEGRL